MSNFCIVGYNFRIQFYSIICKLDEHLDARILTFSPLSM